MSIFIILEESIPSLRDFLWLFLFLLHRNYCKQPVKTLVGSALFAYKTPKRGNWSKKGQTDHGWQLHMYCIVKKF